MKWKDKLILLYNKDEEIKMYFEGKKKRYEIYLFYLFVGEIQ